MNTLRSILAMMFLAVALCKMTIQSYTDREEQKRKKAIQAKKEIELAQKIGKSNQKQEDVSSPSKSKSDHSDQVNVSNIVLEHSNIAGEGFGQQGSELAAKIVSAQELEFEKQVLLFSKCSNSSGFNRCN